VTTRNPNPAPHSEEELLEQWDFLDRLVERQAAQLRAGIQDTEEVDEPAIGMAEVESLRREVARLRTDLRAAQAAREAAEAALRRSGEALISLTASRRNPDEEERSRERARALERAAATWRERAETAERALGAHDLRSREEAGELSRRLAAAEAGRRRAEQEQAEALEALTKSRLEIDSLRAQLAAAAAQHSFWHFGRR
jgi:predicted  nucleic acid-binding Zn-ribbon protein